MWEVRKCRLKEENRSKYIDGVLLVESICGDILQHLISCNSSIVDDDVDLELAGLGMRKVVLCRGNEMSWAVRVPKIGLNRQCLYAMVILEGRAQGFGLLSRRV